MSDKNWRREYRKRFPKNYDKDLPHKFLVYSEGGEYEDRYQHNIGIVDTVEEAEKLVDSLYDADERERELAIKDDPWPDDEYHEVESEPQRNTPYTDLYNEWQKAVVAEYLPRLVDRLKEYEYDVDCFISVMNEDNVISEEECDQYYDIINDKDNKFKEFLINKGYSEEVAAATIAYDNGYSYYKDSDYDYDPVRYLSN